MDFSSRDRSILEDFIRDLLNKILTRKKVATWDLDFKYEIGEQQT